MANINFPGDGQGTQALKKLNRANSLVADVDTVTPDPENQKKSSKSNSQLPHDDADATQDNNHPQPATSEPKVSRQHYITRTQDRRQHNRRRKNEPVLLNTRSEHERRKQAGQREQDQLAKSPDDRIPTPQRGIDTEA